MFKLLWAWATVSFSTHPECLKAPFTSIWSFETFTSSEFAQLMLQQLRQVYTKSCNYKIANNLDYVQTSRCVHIHYVQTRHCVHIVYVQTSHSVHIHYVQTRPTLKFCSAGYNAVATIAINCYNTIKANESNSRQLMLCTNIYATNNAVTVPRN